MKCSECHCSELFTDRYGRDKYFCAFDIGEEEDKPCYGDWEPEEEYTPSASAGDYSPSNPWNAPGMSLSDFI